MGAAARQRVETTFTADAQALAVQRVYDSILVNRKPLLAHPGSEGDVRRRAIVHLTPKLNTYGACRVAHSIAQRQCAKDQVTMLALEEPKGEGRLPSPEVCSQVLFPQGVPRGTLPTRTVLVAWKTRAALKALRPDLVHVHIFGEGLALCLAAWMSGAPYAGHLHTVPTAGGTTGIGRNVLRYLRVFFRQGNLLALTPAGQEAFAEQGLLADVVPNGIDLSWFDSQLRDLPPAFADGATARVLLVGKLVSYKDPMTFLRAAQRVVAGSGPGVRFYLAGEGDLRGSLTNQIRELGLSSSVVLLGLRDNVPALMRDCDVVCLTSLEEGFGLVLAEAGAARKPCVATATSGARCVVQDGLTGFTVPVGDDQALADRLLQLVGDDDLRRSMGEAARQRVETLYTLDAQMLALERAYERVLASSRRCRPATRERA
jgi:glycosyltransferase involved in cell wall biosynthesis